MPKRTRSHHEWLVSELANPLVAASYVNEAVTDSPEMFLKALRNVAEAKKMARVAEETGLSRESLYRTLSDEGNPRLDTLFSVLKVFGLKIAVEAEPIYSMGATGFNLPESTQSSGENEQSFSLVYSFGRPAESGGLYAQLSGIGQFGQGDSRLTKAYANR